MLMKKMLILLFATMGLTAAQADNYDYPYLVFQTNGGTVQTVSAQSLTITIADGQLVATNADGSQTFPLAELSKMYFSATATAIGETPAATTTEPVEVFTLSGLSMGTYENLQQAQATLQKGIYVVRSGRETLKIAVK